MGLVDHAKVTKVVAFEAEVRKVVDLKEVVYFLDLDEAFEEAEDLAVATSANVEAEVGTSVTVQKRRQRILKAEADKEVLATKGVVEVATVWYLLPG